MKPILCTPEMKEEILDEIIKNAKEYIAKAKLSDGKFEYKTNYTWDNSESELQPINIEISAKAYVKMLTLVQSTDKEVAWNGTVERIDDVHFVIKDIFIYPQKVTGVKVTTDESKLQKWQESLDFDDFKSMRFQGHSHVDMGTSPSSTDLTQQKDFLSQLTNDDYYIFMIINKKNAFNAFVYDLKTNTYYTSTSSDKKPEIIFTVEEGVEQVGNLIYVNDKNILQEVKELMSDVKKNVTTMSYNTNSYNSYSNYQSKKTSKSFQNNTQSTFKKPCVSYSEIASEVGCSFLSAQIMYDDISALIDSGAIKNTKADIIAEAKTMVKEIDDEDYGYGYGYGYGDMF